MWSLVANRMSEPRACAEALPRASGGVAAGAGRGRGGAPLVLVENLELAHHLPPRVVVEHVDGLRGSVALALAAANGAS